MKKRVLLFSMFLFSLIFPISAYAENETYDNGIFSFSYDSDVFTVELTDAGTIRIKAIDMPDHGTRHNTVLACMSQENTDYDILGSLSDSDLQDFKKTFTREMCIGLFEVDPGLSISSDGYKYDGESCEYSMVISDETECYITVYNYGETVYYSVCRLCPYTAELNDGFRNIYQSIKLSNNEESSTETVSEIEVETETEIQTETETETETETDSETEVITETESETLVETESESDISAEKETTATQDDSLIDGFRDIKWGTDIEDVKNAVITDDMVEDVDYGFYDNRLIIPNSSVAGYDAMIGYEFDSDSKLSRGIYGINEEHVNKTAYYDDYCDLVELYTDKYGEPDITVDDWKNDLYKDSPEDWGLAVSIGHVQFLRQWVDDKGAQIGIVLTGDNFEISLGITYSAPDYETVRDTSGI